MIKTVKIVTPSVINPFLYYAVIWFTAIVGYILSPSQLNQPFDDGLFAFLMATILAASIAAVSFNKIMRGKIFRITYQRTSKTTMFILLCMAAFFVLHRGSIPFIASLMYGAEGEGAYSNFGRGQIGTITPLFTTFISFLAVKSGYQYSVFRQKRDLYILLSATVWLLLSFTRSGLILIWLSVIPSTLAAKRITMKSLLICMIVFLAGAYIFGILGNIRCGSRWNDASVIMRIAKIPGRSDSILAPLYWAYEYMISPLRNLIFNVNKTNPNYNLLLLLQSSVVPDLISRRIFPGVAPNINLVNPILNVSTCYAGSWGAFGYAGITVTLLAYTVFAIWVICIRDRTQVYKISMISVLCTIFAFSIFSNSLMYSGWSAVIVWGMIILTKRRLLAKNV